MASDPSTTGTTPRWRRIVGIAMIALGALLAPVALVSTWAVHEFSDTDAFVETFAPLGADDDVQSFVAAQVTQAIETQVDFASVSSSIVSAVIPGEGAVGATANQALTGVLEQSLRQLVAGGVSRVVESDAFSAVWEQSLRASHGVLVSALEGDPDALLALSADGEVGIQLGPIVSAVRDSLVDGGLGFASAIPDIDRTVVIATSESLATVQMVWNLAHGVAFWLPWVALVLVLAGLLVAGPSVRCLVASAGGIALGMIVLLIGLAIGRSVVIGEFEHHGVPDAVGPVLFDQIAGGLYAGATTVLVVVLLIAVAAWLFGPFDVVGRVRRLRETPTETA